VPDPIKAMEMMNQLNLGGGDEPAAKARSRANDKEANPETAKKFESAMEKAKAEISKMAEETRAKAEAERPRTYTERLQDMGRLPKPSGGGGGGGGGGMPKLNRDITKNYKAGGKVSSASKRADGCCIRGKTKA
jgi:ABC-type nitrate/sulfonate/bicarbonate transport system substrate-binding protein